jgi:hypothetical protein
VFWGYLVEISTISALGGSGAGFWGSRLKGEEKKILVTTLAAKSSLFYIFTIIYALVHIK